MPDTQEVLPEGPLCLLLMLLLDDNNNDKEGGGRTVMITVTTRGSQWPLLTSLTRPQ